MIKLQTIFFSIYHRDVSFLQVIWVGTAYRENEVFDIPYDIHWKDTRKKYGIFYCWTKDSSSIEG